MSQFSSIAFSKTVGFLGRNGYFKAIGLEISTSQTNGVPTIMLQPTSTRDTGRSLIEFPVANAEEVAKTILAMTRSPLVQKYLEAPNTCPFCDSVNISADHYDHVGETVYQNITCCACGKEWTDTYELVNMEEVKL
jgi:hypothetical protein